MDFASSTWAAGDRARWKGIVVKIFMVPHKVIGYCSGWNRLDFHDRSSESVSDQ